MQFANVTAIAKANIYFDGNVVSHGLIFPDGSKKTLGIIYPGTYHFSTDKAERMEIIAGTCVVKLDGSSESRTYTADSSFDVSSKSGFQIEVVSGICEYVCTFLG
jgi:purine/pyrimidine-nucleoside phosphorylase